MPTDNRVLAAIPIETGNMIELDRSPGAVLRLRLFRVSEEF
jgi:hypothetical protein